MPLLRDHRRRPELPPNPRALFVTGGIGDVLTLSCFLELPADLEVIYYATPKFAEVREYLRELAPKARHVSLWEDWSERDCFFSRSQFIQESGNRDVLAAVDWSILHCFHQPLTFRGWRGEGRVARDEGRGIRSLLPARYAVFCPFTTDKRSPRDFTDGEIDAVIRAAQEQRLPLVILNAGGDRRIEADGVINLQNQTSLLGSIAVTCGAAVFVGVDSSQSVVATKFLPAERLLIKSDSENLRTWKHLYYAPHTSFEFIVPRAVPRLKELSWIE